MKEMAEEFEAQRDAEEALRLKLLRVNKKMVKKEEGEEEDEGRERRRRGGRGCS